MSKDDVIKRNVKAFMEEFYAETQGAERDSPEYAINQLAFIVTMFLPSVGLSEVLKAAEAAAYRAAVAYELVEDDGEEG